MKTALNEKEMEVEDLIRKLKEANDKVCIILSSLERVIAVDAFLVPWYNVIVFPVMRNSIRILPKNAFHFETFLRDSRLYNITLN